jgi:hypothetical protein
MLHGGGSEVLLILIHGTNNKEWQSYLEPGLRYLSTVHFMDSGYWLWVIPLGSKNTSIGIVADPAIIPSKHSIHMKKQLNG